jgi:hypothetical protein
MGDGITSLVSFNRLLPAVIGIPLIIRALLWHPLARRPSLT